MLGPVHVLAIDGGGIRGIIPALVLAELERLAKAPVASLFHLVAGTSTGGILAAGLTQPDTDGTPRFSAEALVDLYETEGPHIFSRSLWHRATALENLVEEKYPARGMEEVLERRFGDARLADALTDVLIPCYEIERRLPFFFRSSRARHSADYDYPLAVVARATAAAPTYFEPVKVPVPGKEDDDYYALIDGGVFANNPAMCAYVEALTTFPEATEILVVSVGTGEASGPIHYHHAKGWGLVEWLHPLLGVVFDGVSDTVSYQLEQLCNREELRRYWRFQTRLPAGRDAIDDASRDNLRALRLLAEDLVRERAAELADVASRLTAGGER